MGDDLDAYIRMRLVGDDMLMSDRSTSLMRSQNIKTFVTLQHKRYKGFYIL